LDRLHSAAELGGRFGSLIEIGVMQALAHQAHGDITLALAALDRALRLAQLEGHIRMIADEGPAITRLLAATAQEPHSNYIGRLLAAMHAEPHDRGRPTAPLPAASSARPTSLAEPLSERELDVLRLLVSELNGPEIADRLMVSLNTMRTHTKNIYSKLGVGNRRAAIQRAQELDLL
jgi:LuxR family maltose regulon positive regulatory protein